MSFFDKLFKKAPKTATYAPMLNGMIPAYGQYGTNIYYSDAVVQALKCIVDEIKKLNPKHIRMKGNDPQPVRGDVQDVLDNPNPIMTTTEFIEKITWLLLMNYNAFILPIFQTWRDEKTGQEHRYYKALYPLNPMQVDFIEDASGKLYVKLYFPNGSNTTIPYEDIIHIKYNYAINQFMGGDEFGQPDHKALISTLEMNKTILDGIAKAMKASYAVNGIVKYNTFMSGDETKKAVQELERKLLNNESGFLPIDLKEEFIPIQRKAEIVNSDTLKFVDEKILRNFGVPLCILTGDYTKEQYEAFYQKTLEPLIKCFSEAFTKKIFTDRERSFGNKIMFYPKDLIFMTVAQTLDMINILAPTGAMFENEKRVALGLPPIPELAGKRYMSLNWINANNADQYQVGKVDVVDEVKEDM